MRPCIQFTVKARIRIVFNYRESTVLLVTCVMAFDQATSVILLDEGWDGLGALASGGSDCGMVVYSGM